MRVIRWLAVSLALLIGATTTHAFELQPGVKNTEISAGVSLLEDRTGKLDFTDISNAALASRFTPWDPSRGSINLGFTESALWVRLVISRAEDAPDRWLLQVPYAYNKFLDFYAPDRPPVFTGSGRPVSTRPIFDRFFVFPITVTTEPQVFYFRVASSYAISVPLQIWEPNTYSKNIVLSNLANSLYYGALLALAIYNLFLFFSLNDRRFLYYALFALSLNAGIFSGNGLMQLFIWPDWIAIHEISSQFFIALSGFAGIRFCRLFLRISEHSSRINGAMLATEIAYLVLAVLLISTAVIGNSPQWMFQVLLVTSALSGALVVAGSVQAIRHKISGIRFFVIAWGILLAGTMVAGLRQVDMIPTNVFTSYALQIASAFEMLLLALALAEIVQVERRARLQAKAEAIAANEKLIETLQVAEQRLESAVRDRTKKLEESVLREQHLLKQYLRFGAMISHEFRNPLGIIDSQATLIQKSEKLPDDLHQRLGIIRKTVRRLADLFELWLQGDRIRLAIDKLDVQKILLKNWAETLVHKIPHCAESHPIAFEFDSDADHVWADSTLLEIAVINLIENACKYTPPGSPVVLKGVRSNGRTGICVADYGPGIDPEHLARLGEEYYRADPDSTKGIGLGLSVVKEIAEVHGGALEIQSTLGSGSRFTLMLPDRHDENT